MPSRFIRFDALDLGVWTPGELGFGPGAVLLGVAKVTVVLNRVRFGASFAEEWSVFDYWGGDMMLPLHVGYTFYSSPKKTCLFWSHLTDVYAEVSGSLIASDNYGLFHRLEPGLRTALCLESEYYGLGTRLEVGWADIYADIDVGPWKMSRVSFFYIGLQLRFATFGIGF